MPPHATPESPNRAATLTDRLKDLHPRPLKRLHVTLAVLVRTRLWAQILLGMALGILAGTILSPRAGFIADQATADAIGSWLALPGLLFLKLISMIVLPLVFCSIILGLASSESTSELKKVGLRVAPFFVVTTALACVIGLAVGAAVNPGGFIPEEVRLQARAVALEEARAPTEAPEQIDRPTLADTPQRIVDLLPSSPLEAAVNKAMLQWVLFSLVVGIAVVQMAPKASRPLIEVLGSVQEVCMTVIKWAMFIAPAAVFGLLAQITIRIGIEALLGMSAYVGAVVLALLLLMVMYAMIAWIFARIRPLRFLGASREVLLLAFATSSSAAVMPLSIKVAEEKLGVRAAIARFVVPLGATVNMAGTAAYQCVATMFLVQVFDIELSTGQLAMVVLTAVGASVGAPASPGVGIVVLSMILTSVNVPPAGIALIIGVDRILDMCRTVVNVTGDLVACVVMDRTIGPEP
ncbi:MAG: dicarboxylate/amino acid:cation symporter [Phycisphaerales bacterium]|nr:MAG: dicarboxylate/amino acid:cation symporter [Phycisphaerales bacterium]